MKVAITKDSCIGCGACVSICPEVFSFDDEGFANANSEQIDSEKEARLNDAIESCPTEAIFKEE